MALIPNFAASARVEWVDLRWDPRASLLRSVRASRADLSDPAVAHALGRWRDLDLSSSPPALTCRSDEPSKLSLVCYVSVNVTPSAEGHGCCADGIEVHNRRGPPTLSRVVAFLPAVREALEADGLPKSEAETAFATHTLHVARGPGACGEEDEEPGRVGGGQLCVLLVLRYSSPSQLGGSNGDALVLLSVGPSGEARVIPTASGRLAFVNVRDVGTFETSEVTTLPLRPSLLHVNSFAGLWNIGTSALALFSI